MKKNKTRAKELLDEVKKGDEVSLVFVNSDNLILANPTTYNYIDVYKLKDGRYGVYGEFVCQNGQLDSSNSTDEEMVESIALLLQYGSPVKRNFVGSYGIKVVDFYMVRDFREAL